MLTNIVAGNTAIGNNSENTTIAPRSPWSLPKEHGIGGYENTTSERPVTSTDWLNPESQLSKEFNKTMESLPIWGSASSTPPPSMLQKLFTIFMGNATTETSTLQVLEKEARTLSKESVLSRKSKCLEHEQEEVETKEVATNLELEQAKAQLPECMKRFEHNLAFYNPDLLIDYPRRCLTKCGNF